jgi:hypothetical protein
MFDYIFDEQTRGWKPEKLKRLIAALRRVVRSVEPKAREVRVVDYPAGSVRILGLYSISSRRRHRLTDAADGAYRVTMGVD